ncbi:TPA: fimbrial biogenesis outer membrane usher protein [Escherichia coli]|jgi:outer membrane usher protein|uniref:fimbria/pilus outer membrane usher protein n=1 Tax=Escherichia coli TaxID=562 RepID=UPI00068DD3D2|nr:fimbria/pilus outer membrane usher protein [Escherichia coli]EFL2424925.1 fimbrial biogenesis outer membrane usher protein [Escherichia coli]EHJ8674409.1 fimbrial biogenesis outer membrane usher protein [Escherichia coli]EIH6333607.1 fimbrial biogenesis outer membrane usher protein [Escherichia coli]EJV4826499.1 fimbrial biogenesis outer membrane usher protein [Escherichia coli]MBA1110311.1 fimbrial biogenesis outer membrane usher protein [Escherichia coli]
MKQSSKKMVKLTRMIILCLLANYSTYGFTKGKYNFNPSLLDTTDNEVDLSYFSEDKPVPGVYIVDIYVNNTYIKTESVEFAESKEEESTLTPCLTYKTLLSLGVKPNLLKEGKNFCELTYNLRQWTFNHNVYQQSLYIKIPETQLNKTIDGIVPKELWDDGIYAAFINHNTTASVIKNKHSGYEQKYAHLDLLPGINLGTWRFRNVTYLDYSSSTGSKWRNINNYVERNLKEIDSKLILGDFITISEIFEGVSMRGATLSTDESMIPSRVRKNTPAIRGVANTQAQVDVMYNDYIIYSTTVEPGVFELTEVPYVSGNGVYKVIVKESNGTKREFFVPFTIPPISVKEGFAKYDLSYGRFRGRGSGVVGPDIYQGTYTYGFTDNLTMYSGLQYSNIYEAYVMGVGIGLGGIGAFSVDGTYASAEFSKKKEKKEGGAVTFKYNKNIDTTNTNLYLTSHQYRSKNYRTLSDTYNSLYHSTYEKNTTKNTTKNLTSIGLTQDLGEYGGLRLSYNYEQYWDSKSYKYLDTAYYNYFKGINYSIGYNEQKYHNKKDSVFTVAVNIPFRLSSGASISSNYRFMGNKDNNETHVLGLTGSSSDNSLSWNIDQRYNNRDSYGMSGNIGVRNQYGRFGFGGATNQAASSYNVYHGGSLLLTKHGITIGQEINQSSVILTAPGASNTGVTTRVGVKTNSNGNAIVSGLSPYKENIVSLNPLELPDDVEIAQTDIKVVPTAGAIVEGRFKTNIGSKGFFYLRTSSNKPVPFGSVVSVKNSNTTAGIVGEDGEVFLSGLPDSGVLEVKWGKNQSASCVVEFDKSNVSTNEKLACR